MRRFHIGLELPVLHRHDAPDEVRPLLGLGPAGNEIRKHDAGELPPEGFPLDDLEVVPQELADLAGPDCLGGIVLVDGRVEEAPALGTPGTGIQKLLRRAKTHRVPGVERRPDVLIHVDRAGGSERLREPFEEPIQPGHMMQRSVEEHDVVAAAVQARIVEVSDAIVDARDTGGFRLPPGVLHGRGGNVEGIDLRHESDLHGRPFEAAEPAAPGDSAGEGLRHMDPLEPVERPFVRGPGHAAVDRLPADGMRHPVSRIPGRLAVFVPVPRDRVRSERPDHHRQSSIRRAGDIIGPWRGLLRSSWT